MIEATPPGLILIVGAFISVLLPGRVRNVFMLILPILGFWQLTQLEHGLHAQVELFGQTISLESFAQAAGTIPYEILTGITARVHRQQRGN